VGEGDWCNSYSSIAGHSVRDRKPRVEEVQSYMGDRTQGWDLGSGG
jgi:hypothetical protein